MQTYLCDETPLKRIILNPKKHHIFTFLSLEIVCFQVYIRNYLYLKHIVTKVAYIF
jgi:hypothetical protein